MTRGEGCLGLVVVVARLRCGDRSQLLELAALLSLLLSLLKYKEIGNV